MSDPPVTEDAHDIGRAPLPARTRGQASVDAAGAGLMVIGLLGAAAWAWVLVDTQFLEDDPGSLRQRLDDVAQETPALVLAGIVLGLGVGLRVLAASRAEAAADRSVFGRPFGRLLLAVLAVALALAVGVAAREEDPAPTSLPLPALPIEDIARLGLDDDPPEYGGPPPSPAELRQELAVDSDGCSVVRSGRLGDSVAWVIVDDDGERVLGRPAGDELRYRYTRPGRYTVVLQARDADLAIVDVSNTVTVTC